MYGIKLSPRSERESLIAKRVRASTKQEPLFDFRGPSTSLPVIVVHVDKLVYRMENCRTFAEQQDLIASKELDPTYFTRGQELSTAQKDQHKILEKLAKRGTSAVSPITDVLQTEGQRESILITHSGVVVNGNRRLCAMREIFSEEGVNSRFAHVTCQVLPADTTRDEVDDIEANEQARPQTKLEYDWIGDAQLIHRQVNKGRSTKEVARQLRRNESEIKNLLQSLEEADLYLQEWAKKPKRYTLVSGDAQQLFSDLPKRLTDKSVQLKQGSRAIAWSLYDNREKVPGRVYSFNRAFGELAEEVLDEVAKQLDVSTVPTGAGGTNDSFAIDIEGDEEPQKDYSNVINRLRNEDGSDEVPDIVVDVCQSAIEKKREQDSRNAPLRAITQAKSKLARVDISVAERATYPKIEECLYAIEEIARKLLEKIDTKKTATDGEISDEESGAKHP